MHSHLWWLFAQVFRLPPFSTLFILQTTISVEFKPVSSISTYELQYKSVEQPWSTLKSMTVPHSSGNKGKAEAHDLQPGTTYCLRLVCVQGGSQGNLVRIDYWYGTSWLYSTAIRWLWLCYTVNKGSFRISLLLCVSCSDYDFATHFRVATTFVVDTCCYRRNKNEFVYLLPGTAFWPLEVFCKL